MTKSIFFSVLLSSFCASTFAAGNFEFDIPSQSQSKETAKTDIRVVKPNQVTVKSEPSSPRVSIVIPVLPPKQTNKVAAKSTSPAAKDIYRIDDASKNSATKVVNADKLCSPTTIAMTFHNVPTQKGPYFHRWISLGCQVDEINFVQEGNEQYSMNWKLSYVPADDKETARYALRWKINGTDDKGIPVNHEASHTFNLDKARTLSLTNNMAVSLRKVP